MHVHLDPVGGVAGDMFVAALLDAWPELAEALPGVLAAAGLPTNVSVECLPWSDRGLQGKRYQVIDTAGEHSHAHTPFRIIRERLWNSALSAGVKARAVDIFTLLAQAEAQVHGIGIEEIVFHEVGAWDSIADIVASAFLVESLAITSWSVSALPLGSGRIRTAHGSLPVPAPATALLLQGFVVQDDGREGERVTPTGAAILKHLAPSYRPPAQAMVMGRTGIGFGSRYFEGIPNILRLIALESVAEPRTDEVAVLQFEVDDQPAEDLAMGLEKLRNLPAVIDVIQLPAFGKQGRLTTQIQLLARTEALEAVITQCFLETSTLGLRWQLVRRSVLEREMAEYDDGERHIRVKLTRRPQGLITAKAEMRDVAPAGGFADRARLRQQAEQNILNRREHDDD
ncbi:MAG: nickel pincer cofactor biosynthesis protein LarC [Candidatus Competibacteraceae bacterium]